MTTQSPYNLRQQTRDSPSPRSPKPPTKTHNKKGKKKLQRYDEDTETSSQDDSFSTDNSYTDNTVDSVSDISSSFNRGSSLEKSPSVPKKTNLSSSAQLRKRDIPKQQKECDKETTKNEYDKEDGFSKKVKTLIVLGLLAISFICGYHLLFAESEKKPVDSKPLFEQFKDVNLKILKEKFPSQNKAFWKTIMVPLKRIFTEENPEYPAVLLFAIPKGPSASWTGSCIAHQLTYHLNNIHGLNNGAFINIEKDLTHRSPSGDKRELDDKLIDFYGGKASKGVVVDHFEKLSPMATLLFHGYCDGDNAPYKNVSMILVVHTDIEEDVIVNDKYSVDNYLHELWVKELDEDKIPPLISRIANNVAIVTPEKESQSVHKLCPWLKY